METPADVGFFQWLIGVGVTVIGSMGAVVFHIYGRIDVVSRDVALVETRLRGEIEVADKELDKKIEVERESNRTYREAMIAQVAALPTKDDMEKMETRIMGAIRANGSRPE